MLNRIENERIKRAYLRRLRDAQGLSESTIEAVEKAIWLYEDFSKHEDYRKFDRNKACEFKSWLDDGCVNAKWSTSTMYQRLKHLKNFFIWLSGQPGYKTRIRLDDVEYLNLDRNRVREATFVRSVDFPSLEYVRRLVESIEIQTEIDSRDRALISFLLLSGMRDRAAVTLPLGCFDRESLQVRQMPSEGVLTKYGKPLVSWLFRFDEALLEHVIAWSEYLEHNNLYSSESPLFPKTRIVQKSGSFSFMADGVEPHFWANTGPVREILRVRADNAGLRYYHPHTFRHLAVSLALKGCRNAAEMKAVSQNLGHAHVATTMMVYGRLHDHEVAEIVERLGKSTSGTEELSKEARDEFRRLLDKMEK
jgi:integrase